VGTPGWPASFVRLRSGRERKAVPGPESCPGTREVFTSRTIWAACSARADLAAGPQRATRLRTHRREHRGPRRRARAPDNGDHPQKAARSPPSQWRRGRAVDIATGERRGGRSS